MADPTALVERFFHDARLAVGEGRFAIGVGESDVLLIADSADSRGRFRAEFKKLNDPDLQETIMDYLGEIVSRLEFKAERTDVGVDLLDRAALAPSAASIVTGVAIVLGSTGIATPFLLGGGITGLIVSAVGRTILKTSALRAKQGARHVRLLLGLLK